MDLILENIFNEMGTFNNSIFHRIHSYLIDNHHVYYDSFENYQARTDPPLRRKLIFHTQFLILFSTLIKFTLLIIYDQDWVISMTGEGISQFVTQYKFFWVLIIVFMINFTLQKLIMFYFEKELIFDCSKLKMNMNNILNTKYNSLLILANTLYWTAKTIHICLYFDSIILFSILNIVAYYYNPDKFNPIILLISTLQWIITIKICFSSLFSLIMVAVIMGMYMKWKQDELIKSIRYNLLWRNKVKLYDNIQVCHWHIL